MLAWHGCSLSLERGSAHQASPGDIWAHRCQFFPWPAARAPSMGAGTSPLFSQLLPRVKRPEQGPGLNLVTLSLWRAAPAPRSR